MAEREGRVPAESEVSVGRAESPTTMGLNGWVVVEMGAREVSEGPESVEREGPEGMGETVIPLVVEAGEERLETRQAAQAVLAVLLQTYPAPRAAAIPRLDRRGRQVAPPPVCSEETGLPARHALR